MKNISKIGMIVTASGMLAVTSCSDFSDYNTEPEIQDLTANQTLWQNISANPNLSDFAEVLKRVGYDKVLDAAHTYTVWAPVNGSFNKDSLAALSDTKVENEFLRNLIADYAHRENDVNDTTIYMLNKKLLKFSNKNTASLSFDGKAINANGAVFNYPSSNGLLYTMQTPAEFRYNAYEMISELQHEADSFYSFVKRYEQIYLNRQQSVPGAIIDGVQHYDDSVTTVRNTMLEQRYNAKLNDEDSLYTLFVPNNEAWAEAYERISSYYNYIPTIDYQDLDKEKSGGVGNTKGGSVPRSSTGRATIMAATVGKTTVNLNAAPADAAIQETGAYWTDSITKRLITYPLYASETNQRYNSKLSTLEKFVEGDTLMTTSSRYALYTNLPAIDAATERVINLSNGHARVLNKWAFDPEETYAPIIESQNVGRVLTANGATAERMTWLRSEYLEQFVTFEKESDRYFTYIKTDLPSNSSFAPELDFYLNDVLSTTYDVYAIIVPACLEDPTVDKKPYTLRFDINYTDANNKQIAGTFDGETVQEGVANITKVQPFVVGAEKVDTVKLGRITFPICYAGTEARPNIKVMHTLSTFMSANKRQYEQILRVGGIRLVPVKDDEQNATKED